MTLLHPAMLLGLLAVGLPVLIHLLSKPRLKRVRWAAMRFLLDAVQKNKRRLQAEDLLLLILRALLVALLVLLFARPALLTDALPQLGGLAAPAVIILDNSASMGQSDGTATRFEQAKARADDLLGKLAPGSACALYLVSDRIKAVISRPSQDMAILKRSIDDAPLTDGGSDLYPGIKAAVDLLKSLPGTHREIFVMTDGQNSALRQLGNIRELQQANKDITVHFSFLGDKGEDNLAVSNLQLSVSVASVGEALHCVVTVSNWGQTAVTNVPVKLSADRNPPEDEGTIARIEPNTSANISLVAHFRDAGHHSLTASIPGDRLPADNERSTALLVIEQIHALVIEGTVNLDPAERDGFFLRHALVPVSPEQAERYHVSVTVGRPDDLENPKLDQYQLIALSNVPQLTPRGAQNLHDYVVHGGGVVIFPGPDSDPNFYNGDANFHLLMPAKLNPPQDPPAGQAALGWQSSNYEHPLVTLWNQPESGSLKNVRVTRYFPLTLNPAGGAGVPAPQVVLKYTDGEPAIVEQPVGKGDVILFSSTATTTWTNFPIHPSFVPLLSRIISFQTSGLSGTLNISPGQAFSSPIEAEAIGREISVIRPGDDKRRIVGEVESSDKGAALRYADTEKAGVYQLFVGDDKQPKNVFAVQMPADESNLAQAPKTDLATLENPLSGTDAAVPKPNETAADAPSRHIRIPGRELWIPLALAALVLALGEMMLAHVTSQSK